MCEGVGAPSITGIYQVYRPSGARYISPSKIALGIYLLRFGHSLGLLPNRFEGGMGLGWVPGGSSHTELEEVRLEPRDWNLLAPSPVPPCKKVEPRAPSFVPSSGSVWTLRSHTSQPTPESLSFGEWGSKLDDTTHGPM